MIISRGDPTVFVTRPISAFLLLLAVAALVVAALPAVRRKREVVFTEEVSASTRVSASAPSGAADRRFRSPVGAELPDPPLPVRQPPLGGGRSRQVTHVLHRHVPDVGLPGPQDDPCGLERSPLLGDVRGARPQPRRRLCHRSGSRTSVSADDACRAAESKRARLRLASTLL